MIISGHIVTRRDGGPLYGYGQTIRIYDSPSAAAGCAAVLDKGMIHEQLGPLSVAAVEIRILSQSE